MALLLPPPGRGLVSRSWMLEREFSPRSSSQFLYTVPDLPGIKPSK